MKKRTIVIFLLFIIPTILNAQETVSEKEIYWQPDRRIEFSDYQSSSDTNCVKYNKLYNIHMQASIGFRWVVDIPKKWKGKIDKGYIVPVFCKHCSCILKEDSLELKVDRLLFDITELCARNVRKEINAFQKEGNIDNPNEMYFISVKNKWDEQRKLFFGGAIQEILLKKQEGAYEKWRKTTDEMLNETKEYATKPEDCSRIILGKPIEKDYKIAKNIIGDLRSKEK